MSRKFLFLGCALSICALALPSTARATAVTFTFEGVVTRVQGSGQFCPEVNPGTTALATVSYDMDAPPDESETYSFSTYVAQASFSIGATLVNQGAAPLTISNDAGAGENDAFDIELWRGGPVDWAGLFLTDQDGTLYDDESLPDTLDLDDFEYRAFIYSAYGAGCQIDGEWTSVTGGIVDSDGDGIADDDDNCPDLSNGGQADADGDQVGDACEVDADADGVDDNDDNCPGESNPDQADNESDGLGDLCDDDDDDDGKADTSDNCGTLFNSDQVDRDGDGQGDACDGDDDGDGVADEGDLCAASSMGVPIGSEGCSGEQLVELQCPANAAWRNHGEYVSCVSGASKSARDRALLTNGERAAIVRRASTGK